MQMIQKLSKRQPSLENKSRIIREIALEKGIEIELDTEELPIEIKELVDTKISPSEKGKNLSQNYSVNSSGVEQDELYLESMEARKKYNSAGSTTDHAAVTAEKKADELSNSQHEDTEGWGSPSNGLREKSPVGSMNEDENIVVHTVPSCRKESLLSLRRLDTRKSREEFVVPPVERSPPGFSLLYSNKPHFQVKRTILNEQDDTESNAIESVPDVNEIEDQSSGNQSEKRYGIGGVSLPTRRLTRFAVINRNSFQLHSMINAALDEEFHDKHEVVDRPPTYQKKNSRKLRDTSLNDEIDKNELQLRNYSSPIDEERSQSDNFHPDSTTSPAQKSKVPNKPDPMRTRRRFHR
ncbi:hypothetical protein J5N97_016872 [Dioscorea zingiberensis]|uniref:Uncharacterized protein n=1 Tax=Dioscorea zingiberensis TaxID=325984 RepID=A0A9D5CM08_9LILI|nr:hypothetical protein J5N97_016872 [Dioscorea zingiberensis]